MSGFERRFGTNFERTKRIHFTKFNLDNVLIMRKEPVKVSLIGKENGTYSIGFPNVRVPVKVNEELYLKMLHSSQYEFVHRHKPTFNSFSA